MTRRGGIPKESVWTEGNMSRLTELWIEGLSGNQIAVAMNIGISRNAVIGKVHRMGLPLRRLKMPKTQARGRRWGGRREASLARESLARIRSAPALKSAPMPHSEAWKPIPGTSPISLLELTDQTCRWPLGDDRPFKFCGCLPAYGSPYCATHKANATRVLPSQPDTGGLPNDTLRFDGAGFGRAL